jgi:hypothetical protein
VEKVPEMKLRERSFWPGKLGAVSRKENYDTPSFDEPFKKLAKLINVLAPLPAEGVIIKVQHPSHTALIDVNFAVSDEEARPLHDLLRGQTNRTLREIGELDFD